MARDPAFQPNLANYEPVQLGGTPAGGFPGGTTSYPPAPNPNLRSPLPPSQQTSVDQLRQFYRIGTPQNRTLPLQPNASPANNAASQTVAQSVAETIINNTPNPVTLTMPVQYTVSGSPGNDLDVAWVPVDSNLALMGPGPLAALESVVPFTSADTPGIDLSITPASPTSWALFVEYSNNNLVAGPTGWTLIHSTSSQNAYYLNVTGTAAVDVNVTLSAHTSCVACLMSFAGPAPNIVQIASGVITGLSGGTTITVTAGNVLWVIAQAYDGGTNFGVGVADSRGNQIDLIQAQTIGVGANPSQTQNIFACPNIASGGSDTITITFFPLGSTSPPDHKEFLIMETAPLSPGNGLPFFREITPSDLPQLENFDGLLPVAKGGTGTATPALVAGSGITISGSWPDQTVATSGGGATPGGSSGDVQVNNSGAFGVATNIQSGAAININSGSLQFTGGIGVAITNGPFSVSAGSSGNIILRTNGGIQIDSNGSHVFIGTTFSSLVELGGASSQLGFFGSSGTTQQTVTGSRGGNAALASLLTALAAHNLIVNSSSP